MSCPELGSARPVSQALEIDSQGLIQTLILPLITSSQVAWDGAMTSLSLTLYDMKHLVGSGQGTL